MSACKAIMEPIGLSVKQRQKKYASRGTGELMLIHRCRDCCKVSINRIAADDLTDRLLDIFYKSFELDVFTQQHLKNSGIRLLQGEDHNLVATQLHGMTQH